MGNFVMKAVIGRSRVMLRKKRYVGQVVEMDRILCYALLKI
jgi:hypothetical protein